MTTTPSTVATHNQPYAYIFGATTRVVKKLSRGLSHMKNWVRRTIGFEIAACEAEIRARELVPLADFMAVFRDQRVRTLIHSFAANGA